MEVQVRPSSEEILMLVAQAMAFRSTCSRLNVGAVIALDRRILTTGYNGAPAGMHHCAHPENEKGGCTNAVHAEANAIAFAARHGVSVAGATLFTTHSPCQACAHLIINSGIVEVMYADQYRDATPLDMLRKAKLNVVRLSNVMLDKEQMLW